jgi:hypothetical protein
MSDDDKKINSIISTRGGAADLLTGKKPASPTIPTRQSSSGSLSGGWDYPSGGYHGGSYGSGYGNGYSGDDFDYDSAYSRRTTSRSDDMDDSIEDLFPTEGPTNVEPIGTRTHERHRANEPEETFELERKEQAEIVETVMRAISKTLDAEHICFKTADLQAVRQILKSSVRDGFWVEDNGETKKIKLVGI